MRRGTLYRNEGIAAVVAAMLLLLLNAAVWLIFNTGSERITFQRALQTSLSRKGNQHIVDNAATIVNEYCSSLILGPGSTQPTAPISEATFRAEGMDLTSNFRTIYTQLGFDDPKTPITIKAFPADGPSRMPSSVTPLLSGLQTTLEVGTGAKQVRRVFTIPVLMNSPSAGTFSVSACKSDEESTHCYLNSNALFYNLPSPSYVIRPTHSNPTPLFDTEETYGRVACFSDRLRTGDPDWCRPETNTLATGLRACMVIARNSSQFVNPAGGGVPYEAAQICGNIANLGTLIASCQGAVP